MSKTGVVAGAGVGGLTAATRLRDLLPGSDRVVLVDRAFDGALGLSLLWVMRGWREPGQVRVRPRDLPGIEMMTADVTGIDPAARLVHTGHGPLPYDALVIALGTVLDPGAVPGLAEALGTGATGEFYTLEGAERLRTQLAGIDAGRVLVLVSGVPYKCPAAPYEGAFLIADLLRERGVRDAVTIDVITPDPLPMPVAGPDVGKTLVGMLEQEGIGFHPGRTVTGVDAGVARHFGYSAPEPYFSGDGACYVEVGGHRAAKGAGNFLDPPAPAVTLYEASEAYHAEKQAQERAWLARWNG